MFFLFFWTFLFCLFSGLFSVFFSIFLLSFSPILFVGCHLVLHKNENECNSSYTVVQYRSFSKFIFER